MGNEKHQRLVWLLSKRTQEKKAPWEATSREGVFSLSLPDFTVWISTIRSDEGTDDIRFQIVNANGQIIDSFTDTTVSEGMSDRGNFYKMAAALYENARRRAFGVDEALDKLINELEG